MQQTLIFDFDGTIADTKAVFIEIYNDYLAKEFYCKRFDTTQEEAFRNKRPAEVLRELQISMWKLPFLVLRGRYLMKQRMGEVKPFPEMKEIIETLSAQGVKMGIVTSNSKRNVQLFLEQHKLSHCFSFINGGKSIMGKERALKKVISQYKLDKPAIIYIGDEVRDVLSTAKVNIRCAAVIWGYHSRALLQQLKPYRILECPKEILNLVQS